MRNLYNSLLNLETFENVSFSLYKVKGKKETNKDKEYSAISVWQNDNLIKGKFKNDELPKPEVITNKAGVILSRDYTDLDNFLESHLAELAKRVANPAKAVKSVENNTSNSPENDENVPF